MRSHRGGYLRTIQLPTSFWLGFHKVWKESSGDKSSTGLFPELTLKELVFLNCEYYSIFLLQATGS
jgi:hypothetical protein